MRTDPIGFPVVVIGDHGFSLWPVTWFQLERHLSEPGGRSSEWYASLFKEESAGVKRASWKNFDDINRDDLFVTRATSGEALEYVGWLNTIDRNVTWELPDVRTWRMLAQRMKDIEFTERDFEQLTNGDFHQAATMLAERLIRQIRPQTWRELALFRGGVFEWVRHHDGLRGLGRPRGLNTVVNPYEDPPVRYVQDGLPRFFGYRPVCRERDAGPYSRKSAFEA